jgi:general secretion pathway protein N
MDSTLAEQAWERRRKAASHWGWAGVLAGGLAATLAFAPASWLAGRVGAASGERLLLADAQGTVWNGSAVPVLAGGPQSRSAALLPGRLHWSLGVEGAALRIGLRQPCCIADEWVLRLRPGFGRWTVELPARDGPIGDWPAAWLAGLGAPWNSLQLGGTVRLTSPGLVIESVSGRLRLQGRADLEIADLSSRLSTLERLGTYRVEIQGAEGQPAGLRLSTVDGALQLGGTGQWSDAHFRFRGEARAAPGFEGALDNLLNLLGRRQGALSLLSIG